MSVEDNTLPPQPPNPPPSSSTGQHNAAASEGAVVKRETLSENSLTAENSKPIPASSSEPRTPLGGKSSPVEFEEHTLPQQAAGMARSRALSKGQIPAVEEGTQPQRPSDFINTRLRSQGTPSAPGYQILGPLGAGTYGEVWLAREERTGIRAAIKFFAHGAGEQWQLLQAEVQQLAQLHGDPGIVQLRDVEANATPPYYVMAYAEQGSVARRLEQGPLPVPEALAIFRRVAEALAYLHVKGIRHCDLKPGNVLLDARGRALLADFGQAHLSSDATPTLGTFFYMAPEQADLSHQIPDTRWDVYGLGALFYAMVTGRPPRENPALREEIAQTRELPHRLERYRAAVARAPRPREHRRLPGMDRSLARIIDRCLEIDPDRRLPDAAGVLAALARRDRRQRQRRLLTFGFSAPLLLLLVVGGLGFWATEEEFLQTRQLMTDQVLDSDQATARLVANVVEERLVNSREQLSQSARRFGAVLKMNDRNELQNMLENFVENQGSLKLSGCAIANRAGKIVARHPPDNQMMDENYSWRDWFNGLGDRTDRRPTTHYPPIRQPYISQPYFGRASNEGMMIAISVPVPDPEGSNDPLGVLVMGIPFATIDAWLAGVISPDRFAVLLTNRRHCVLHENHKERIAFQYREEPPTWTDCPTFEAVLSGEEGRTASYLDPIDNRTYVAGYAPLRQIGWGALFQHESEAAIQPIQSLKRHTILLGGTMVGVALGLVVCLWVWLLWMLWREEAVVQG